METMMKNTWISIRNHIIVFIIVFFVLLLLIIGTACIPKEQIKSNMLESAEYMCEKNTSFLLTDFVQASKIDHYADCITLSIGYELDNKQPIRSAMWTGFYGAPSRSMNEYLRDAVLKDLPANREYLRYWHGQAAAMRVLHTFWNVKQVYVFHVVLIAVLLLLLLFQLIRQKYYGEASSVIFAMFIISVWYVPLCLEYTYTFLCMLIASNITVYLANSKKYQKFSLFFLAVGMITLFFDFLTTETVSLLIPILLLFRIRQRQGYAAGRGEYVLAIKCCTSWLVGFIGMWCMKWISASIILKQSVMPYVQEHISERLSGNVGLTPEEYVLQAIVRNLKLLLPYEYGIAGAIILMIIIVLVVMIPVLLGKVVLKNKIATATIPLYAALSLIPFLRFIVLHNHSYIHYFFTYRALAATILALCFIVLELVEWSSGKAINCNENR